MNAAGSAEPCSSRRASVSGPLPGCGLRQEMVLRVQPWRMCRCLVGGCLGLRGGELGDLGAGCCDELGVGVGVAGEAPAAVGRFGDQYPGALGQARVGGGLGNEVGELPYDSELLVTVERAGVGEDLDPDVGTVTVDVGQRVSRQVVDERG